MDQRVEMDFRLFLDANAIVMGMLYSCGLCGTLPRLREKTGHHY